MTTNIYQRHGFPQELPKAYNPADVEKRWYINWLKQNFWARDVEENIWEGRN